MNVFFKFLILFTFLSCNAQTKNDDAKNNIVADTIKSSELVDIKTKKTTTKIFSLKELKLPKDLSKSYSWVKKDIENIRASLIKKELSKDTLSHIFKTLLLNRIIPYWENTTWSFEGHTSQPAVGEIACGYFVSTTLKDVGLSIDRYKLAQQSPINEAKSLALKTDIIEINEVTKEKNIDKIQKELKEGIHFIGFDKSHVGYILKEKGNLYLIHSNYITGKVEIEQIENSEVFASYSKYYIVELSTNNEFIESWIKKKKIIVIEKF